MICIKLQALLNEMLVLMIQRFSYMNKTRACLKLSFKPTVLNQQCAEPFLLMQVQ